jgi:hypothetical protein
MSLSYKNFELECHCLIKIWSWNVIVLEKCGAGKSLSYKNLELECHCLIVPQKERRRRIIIIHVIIIIIIGNGAKTISLQTLFGRLKYA